MDCPKCGSAMIKRHGKNGDFYGCSRFPACKGTANIKKASYVPRVVEKTSPRNWSQYQYAIFYFVGNHEENLIVQAVAGSGKTTTSVAALNYASRYQNVAFVAFNRSIAQAFADKVPAGVFSGTYHSLGLKSIIAARGKVRVEESKNFFIFNALADNMPDASRAVVMDYRSEALRVASLMKNVLAEPTIQGAYGVADEYGIDTGSDDEQAFVMDTAFKVFQESARDESCVDFDDMIYWCATGRVNPLKFDFVVTDEMQDTNAARLQMLLKMIAGGGRSIAVGDRAQAIYGWAGAHEGAMDAFKDATNAQELPLSITYRCPTSHVEIAKQIVPHLEARTDAPEGVVGEFRDYQLTSMVKDGDMVLCRVNAPLVKPAFQMLAQGRKAVIVGRDIGSNLISLVGRMAGKANNTASATIMLDEFNDYVGKQAERLERQGKFGKADFLRDQLETTEAIADGCATVDEVSKKIESIFSDEKSAGVRFSSVHRAKGLETPQDDGGVYILKPQLMPWPKAVESGDARAIQQEMNVKYVSLTRSKHGLYFES
jgi:superfamily I DNA/RNA helicase